MLSPLTLCFLFVLPGVADAQYGRGASSSMTPGKGHPPAGLRHRKGRHPIISGTPNQLDVLTESPVLHGNHQNRKTGMAWIINATTPSWLEILRGPHRKLPNTHTLTEHQRGFLARISPNVEETPLPEKTLGVAAVSVACCTGSMGNKANERASRGQGEGERQVIRQAEIKMNHGRGHRVPSRPDYNKPHPRSGQLSSSGSQPPQSKPTSYPWSTNVPNFDSSSVGKSNSNTKGGDQADASAIARHFLILFFFFLFPVPLCVFCCCAKENE